MAEGFDMSGLEESIPSAGTDMHQLEGPAGHPDLCGFAEKVWESGQAHDVVITTKGSEIRAHRFVLMSKCSALFTELERMTKLPGRLHLDVDESLLRFVLKFVYTNKVNIPRVDLAGVALVANVVGVTDLHTMCVREDVASIPVTSENCLQLWVKADQINALDIVEKVKRKALENFTQAKKTPGFRALPSRLAKYYLCHEQLKVRSPEDRLHAGLTWIRADPDSRSALLTPIVDTLPLRTMARWYLHQILEEPLIQQQPHLCQKISEALEDTTDRDRCKGDTPACPHPSPSRKTERCLVFVGTWIGCQRSPEVKAIRLDHKFNVVTLGSIPATFPTSKSICTNCCIQQGQLYAAALGQHHDEVWQFSLNNSSSKLCARLQSPRGCHAMCAPHGSQLLILGGAATPCELISQSISSVEVCDMDTDHCSQASPLHHRLCYNLVSMVVAGGEQVLVAGARDDSKDHQLQVVNPRTGATTHSVKIPYRGPSVIYGIVEVDGVVVIVAKYYTATVSVRDVLQGRSASAKLCNNYVTPNIGCALTLTTDHSHLLLLGGWAKEGQPTHYIYQAAVGDVLADRGAGWQRGQAAWSLGKCSFTSGGYDVAHIVIPP